MRLISICLCLCICIWTASKGEESSAVRARSLGGLLFATTLLLAIAASHADDVRRHLYEPASTDRTFTYCCTRTIVLGSIMSICSGLGLASCCQCEDPHSHACLASENVHLNCKGEGTRIHALTMTAASDRICGQRASSDNPLAPQRWQPQNQALEKKLPLAPHPSEPAPLLGR